MTGKLHHTSMNLGNAACLNFFALSVFRPTTLKQESGGGIESKIVLEFSAVL